MKNKKLAVAVSGGVDSVVLLHKLVNEGYQNLSVVHFNHQLRDTADSDELFVKKLARSYGLPFISSSENVFDYCEQNKMSIELGARECRHRFFDYLIDLGFDFVVLAHHADDQIETMLYNMFRGTNLKGLCPMTEFDYERKRWRPFIQTTKNDIEKMAFEYELNWVFDESNNSTVHDRNFLRHDIIPELEQRRPGIKKVLLREAQKFGELNDFVRQQAEEWIKDNKVVVSEFMKLHKVLQSEIILIYWENTNGSRKGFSNARINEVLRWLNNPKPGSKLYFGKVYLMVKNNVLVAKDK